MEINGVEIEDTYAEAFPIKIARVLITAVTKRWAQVAATEATGFGTSVIMCPAEAGIERFASPSETPDGRPGAYIQICTFKYEALEEQLLERIGQCVLTAPTTAVFNGLPDSEKQFNVGFKLKFFGDGMESEAQIAGRKVFKVPIMEGDFVTEDNIGAIAGIAGGNFFIFGDSQMSALTAAEAAVDAIAELEGTITPFPGGIVASGSKSGANKYKFLKATANEKFCPSIKDKVENTEIPADVNAVYEIVINGLDEASIKAAMKAGIEAAVTVPGIKKISAGNYGGKLGKYQFKLHELF
ncbi:MULTISPECIES: formylmethanofuran--tetrahydromethanopterin N-formyltransferase [Methanosarcina]|jgi:formylmethanofuran--tetrahydromethanopterin N-formyltransferase|uniref:Formylmethanofuran--tetrahydromethanopterin formyltransferase n=7 Tax=Methanosarcina mazei TaxID=2209 RepID=FTR_METMA|nr:MULTISPECIES: formylmethanofuran--tetrahydromethanopterin N-formyltransferase [Methanosarcina]Q8PXA1.1 RecName: Full=Formylmethanofuran--tetrahydromethanopterin formyltransferase; Short=Ftr; AltName: Full=H4MPT formyltransferase [Methanosarcina mazei Go1]AAM31017.1 Formylmethanofuran--tetrahydromethanopterin formyltransferase [Methanosarcina mazei Go1]AGF96747.1 Formylmethanofuran--tetrahydromethanopterin N- formyltransferase [Methanosarcina mazei Tuc01]AKB63190.1 Formylmethanofuran--tetrahy